MSKISNEHLRAEHKGVHEQFDMIVAASKVLDAAEERRDELMSLSDKQVKKWIKSRAAEEFSLLGHRPGFIQKGLLVYVCQLLEVNCIVGDKEQLYKSAAKFLDEQFENEGLADACAFIKGGCGGV